MKQFGVKAILSQHFVAWSWCVFLGCLAIENTVGQPVQDSLVLHERSGGPWKCNRDTLTLSKQSFYVKYGGEIYFSGEIHIQPIIYLYDSPQGRRLSISPQVTATVLEDKPLGNRFWLTYRLARQHLDYPEQSVAYIKLHFNNGETLDYNGNMLIPEGATKITSLEIKWKGNELPVTRVFFWGNLGTPWSGSRKWVKIIGIAALAGGIGAVAYGMMRLRQRRLRKDNEREEEQDVVLSITRLDPSVAVTRLHPHELLRVKAVFKKPPLQEVSVMLSSTAGSSLSVKLQPYRSDTVYLSEPIDLVLPEYASLLGILSMQVPAEGILTLQWNETIETFLISWPELPEIPDLPGIRITRNGPQEVVIDPQAGIHGALSVRVIDEFDDPIPNCRIAWHIENFEGSMPCTVTDAEGVTELKFLEASFGGFIPVEDGLPLSDQLHATQYKLFPVVEDATLAPLVSSEAIEFTVDLVAPTYLSILNHEFKPAVYLVEGENTTFRVAPGRADGRGISGKVPVTVIDPKEDSHEWELPETYKKGSYESKEPWEAIYREDGDKVVLRFQQHQVEVPVYKDALRGQNAQLYPLLNTLRQVNLKARQAEGLSQEQQRELHLKGRMIANAIAWLDEPHPVYELPIAITHKYLELLELPVAELGAMEEIPVTVHKMPNALKNTRIMYTCKKEAEEIDAVISITARERYDRNYWIMLSTAVEIIAAPHIGAYTAYTGRDLEGRKVSMLERLAGGAVVVASLLPLGLAFRRYAKAARALERQAINHLDWYATTMERAYLEDIFSIQAATCRQLRSQMASLFSKSVKAEQKILSQAQKALDDIESLEQRITKLEDDIKATKEKLKAEIQRRADDPSLKAVTQEMQSWERGMVRQEKSLDLRRQELQSARTRHAMHVDRLNELYIGRNLEKQQLSKMMDEGILPAQNDKFGGRKSTDLYQVQAEADLAATDSAWAGVTKREIHTPYRQTRWGDKFKVAEKKTAAPEADHLCMSDLKGADSKYWTFWPQEGGKLGNILKDVDTVTHRVRQAVNSIEKGRQIQYNILSERVGRQGMDVWQQVWDLDFHIVTPIPVPAEIQNIIRASVGGAGRNIKFTVVPARLNHWVQSLP